MANGDVTGALLSFERAMNLESNNGALGKEIDTARARMAREEEEERPRAEKTKDADANAAAIVVKCKDVGGARMGSKLTTAVSGLKDCSSMSTTREMDAVNDSVVFTTSDHV